MKMRVETINSYIFIQKVKEHKEIKNKLLSLLDEIKNDKIESDNEKIQKSDYNLSVDVERKYGSMFQDIVRPYNENIKEFYKAEKILINNYWFQQYGDNGYHNFHIHPFSLLSNVYYLELENNNSTVFYDMQNKKEIKYNLEEGDLITFPSLLPHKSQINTNGRKTIISYNSDVIGIRI